MMVSSISTITICSSGGETIIGAWSANRARNREATASSWRTCPNVNARRNEPSVEGAYVRSKIRAMPPCRNTAMSSIESAPATIPPISEVTFNPAFAPLSPGTDKCLRDSSASPASAAIRITGTNPADDTRFGSSNTADVARRV